MFVLAVGLLGVAALIPAGRHEIAQGSRLENAAMVGRAAYRDLQVRGFLNPGDAAGTSPRWYDVNNTSMWDPAGNPTQPFVIDAAPSDKVAYAIDPLGLFAIRAGGGTDTRFPYTTSVADPHLTRIAPIDVTAPGAAQFMDTVFRSSVDLISEENRGEPFDDTNRNGRYDGSESHTDTNGNGRYDGPNADLPPQQFWFRDPTDTDLAANMLRRGSDGNYSWLATIVSDPTKSALSSKVVVTIAVFLKRDLSSPGAGEYTATAGTFYSGGVGGGDVDLNNIASVTTPPQAIKPLRPGQWIMLAGRRTPPVRDYFRWYRVVAARELSGTSQRVTLAGTDWTVTPGTRAWIFDNIVAVYEKNLLLEIE